MSEAPALNREVESPLSVTFPFSTTARHLRWLIGILAAAMAVVLAGTWLAWNSERIPTWLPDFAVFLVHEMNIADENRIGTWYSSVLFVLPAPLALACFWVQHRAAPDRSHRYATYAWLAVAAMFALLSAAELGSLHQRAGEALPNLLDGAGLKGWVSALALPIASVGALLIWFAWRHLRRYPSAFAVMVAATLVYLSIPVQEHIERTLRDEALARGEPFFDRPVLHVILEEGGEMLGSLLFVAAFTMYLAARLAAAHRDGHFQAEAGRARAPGLALERATTGPHLRQGRLEGTVRLSRRQLLASMAATLAFFALGMVVVWALVETWLADPRPHLGRPLNWFPAILATLTALACLYLWRWGAEVTEALAGARIPLLFLALYSLALAMNQGADLAFFNLLWEGNPRWQYMARVGYAAGALGVGLWTADRLSGPPRVFAAVWGLAIAGLFLSALDGLVAPGTLAAYGLLSVGLGLACAPSAPAVAAAPSLLVSR